MPDDFGGSWTEKELRPVRKYLRAYATIMRRQRFRFAYIDAFAGTGYRRTRATSTPLFPALEEEGSRGFIEGSARIALQVEPPFDAYLFIEQASHAFVELTALRRDFPDRAARIRLINADANTWLADLCLNYNWTCNRAVVFLDPFGMQVDWETVQAVAATEAIDLWVLFPLGVAVNRLLKRNGEIQPAWRQRLDRMFGTEAWYDVFYRTEPDLFGSERVEKVANLERIGRFYNDRLGEVFAGVAKNPLPLYNSRGNPLYLLCFAASNPKGAPTALKIAQDILRA